VDVVKPATCRFEYPDILTVLTPALSLVKTATNDLADSFQINACVAPVPRFTIKPESNVGGPDCVEASKISGS